MKKAIFEGVCTALVTPFDENNNIDFCACEKLIEKQTKSGVDAILILGSTGESFALSTEERTKFTRFVTKILPKTCKLIVGAGGNIPSETIRLANEAKSLGADACLVTTPYFNRCTQNGLIQHFEKICQNVDLPMIVYNIPSRSGVNIQPDTMKTLATFDNIVGLKEANGEIGHILEMFHSVQRDLPIYCGNDNLNHIFAKLEASGTISVTSNVFPSEIKNQWKDGNLKLHNKLFKFNNLMFCEPNPIPVKYALSKIGIIKNNLRLPLTPLETQHQTLIDTELKRLGVI